MKCLQLSEVTVLSRERGGWLNGEHPTAQLRGAHSRPFSTCPEVAVTAAGDQKPGNRACHSVCPSPRVDRGASEPTCVAVAHCALYSPVEAKTTLTSTWPGGLDPRAVRILKAL